MVSSSANNGSKGNGGKILVVQIPAYNESVTLPEVLHQIPRVVPGISKVIVQVIDDGSTDGTTEVALDNGADYVIHQVSNYGLSRSFMTGMINALHLGADIVVNTDADNQYPGHEISRLVKPILSGKADIAIGNRMPGTNKHFPFYKRVLQVIGSKVVSWLSGADTPDAVSGFRAYSRYAALHLQVFNEFSYALETIIQANREHLSIAYIPIKTNPSIRPSRLHKGVFHFLYKQGGTIIRSVIFYRPIRSALLLGSPIILAGLILLFRYLYFYMIGESGLARHIQSVTIGGTMILFGFLVLAVGFLGEGIRTNQRMLQEVLVRMRNVDWKDKGKTFDGQDILYRDEQ
jgi:glycosyltransferase involved in cell wall biosynthesis